MRLGEIRQLRWPNIDWTKMMIRLPKEVTKEGTKKLPMDLNAITGYLVINAENIDEALNIAEGCPMITSTKVYELVTTE